ncbi:unnamed protein product, partial [Effrenium voratum]
MLSGLLAAVRELRRGPLLLQKPLGQLLLADLDRIGDGAAAVRELAERLPQVEEEDGWELVEELMVEVFPEALVSESWLETLLRVVRTHSCGRKPGGFFSDTHVAALEMLLEAPRPLREIPPAQWQRMRVDDPQMLQDIQSCEALYGTDAVVKRADRVEIKIEEVLVIYRFDSLDPKRVEVRAKSTGDELVTQAALWLVQSFSGALALSDAVQLARGRAEASAPEPRSALLLATPSCRWLGLQQETAGVPLDFVSPKQAASQASRMIQKYLTSHKVFQPAGNAETVVNERLAERFAEKLEQMRIGSGSFVTPSLVFHGAGSQATNWYESLLGHLAMVWVFALLALAAGCDLEPWLQEVPEADRGYHVLCVGPEAADLRAGGLAAAEPRQLALGDFSARLEAELRIKSRLVFQLPSGGKLKFPKQSWAVFTEAGERWSPEELDRRVSDYRGVLLLFEGGNWRWPGVRLGFRREVLPGVVLRTVALRPALFEVELGSGAEMQPELFADVVKSSEAQLQRSTTDAGAVSQERTSESTWLGYEQSTVLLQLRDFTVQALRIPLPNWETSLQVLRYGPGQFYDAHRDYWDPREFPDAERWTHPRSRTWNMRHATLLWYLQLPAEGGETWFPRAHGGPVPYGEWTACDERGVKMGNGTAAILFYSLYSSGELDTFSWHCACPVVQGTKWAANSWAWNQPISTGPFARRKPKTAQEVLRSICRRGFLMPGDWIEGTPDFLEMEHGNVKGVGVYTSPCLDTAARYGGIEDSEGRGLVLVALAAPGCCWHEKSRQKTQETIRSWFFPSGDVKVGTQHGGWVWQGDAWHPTGAGTSLTPDFAFAPVEALYDGRYHSRRYGIGTQVSEELVLASVDQLLPLLLVPFARRDAAPPAKPLPRLPGLKGPGQGRRHALMGSRIYAYPSEPLPERELTCSKLLAAAAPEEELWALHLPKGKKRRGKELNVIFLVDEALGASEFKAEVLTLLSAIGGQLQAPAAAATFNRQGIVQAGCVPFLPSDAAHASFASRWPRKGCEGAGDLAAALQHVTDMAISKLVKDTERRLQQAASPWAQLAAGHQLVTGGRTEATATVTEVSFEGLKPSSLEVLWHGKAQKSKRLCVVNGDVPVLRVEFEEGEVDFLPPAKLRWGLDPGDVAAEMHFAVFVLSPFTAKDQASGGSLARLETTVQDCGLQLHCSGCRTSVIPLVLGGDASGARLAAFVQTSSNASGEWWMPFYGAETRAEVPGLLEQLQQDMSTWTAHWSEGTQGLVTLGPAAAKLGQGFLGSALGASQPTWELRLQSPSGE